MPPPPSRRSTSRTSSPTGLSCLSSEAATQPYGYRSTIPGGSSSGICLDPDSALMRFHRTAAATESPSIPRMKRTSIMARSLKGYSGSGAERLRKCCFPCKAQLRAARPPPVPPVRGSNGAAWDAAIGVTWNRCVGPPRGSLFEVVRSRGGRVAVGKAPVEGPMAHPESRRISGRRLISGKGR